MDIFRLLTDTELDYAYENVFREAFPPQELKPLSSIKELTERGAYQTLGLFRGGRAVGYICLWTSGTYILVDYLCVPRDLRNGGIGAELIRRARAAWPKGTVFIGEAEAPTGDPGRDEMILRRLGFYARSGARTLGYDTALFGVRYKTIAWSDSDIDEAEALRRHSEIYRSWFTPEMYELAIQIPLREGERVRQLGDWAER